MRKNILPILTWSRVYGTEDLTGDLTAALIVTIMLVPQSLAYALLAGMPPETGIYASILPIVLYTIFGTSHALAVGPVAVVSLMTATAVGDVVQSGEASHIEAALTLAFLSGAILLILGILKLGFMANFLSYPVIAGFITASGILIAVSQLRHILGVEAGGHTLLQTLSHLWHASGDINRATVAIGVGTVGFLLWVRSGLGPMARKAGLSEWAVGICVRVAPVIAIIATTLVVWGFDLSAQGVAIVGAVPDALPPLTRPSFSTDLYRQLWVPALLIAVIGFVESISVAQTLAAKRRRRIVPDQELIALGAANIGAAFTGGFPVTGGFSRSVVNFDAGARTPAAGTFTAAGLAFAALYLTPFIHYLPKATLAATIIVAVLSLVDFSIVKRAFDFSRADFAAVTVTIASTLFVGVEAGVTAGVVTSIMIHLYKTSRPHMAVVGRVPGTQHFRNVLRHEVETLPHLLSLRVDESLYFPNARYLEDQLAEYVAQRPLLTDVVLMFPAVNDIDLSALESLEMINERLGEAGIRLHLSEVKGPVMDRLERSAFLSELTGEIFLSHHDAVYELSQDQT